MNDIIKELTDKDDKKAYARTKEIAAESELSSKYYSCMDLFASLLKNENSYIRTRAFILCCSQARWDNESKFEKLLPQLLTLFHDKKPTVVRQCLNAVKEVIVFKPELSDAINEELNQIDLSVYKDSMVSLVVKDINELRKLIEEVKR